MKKILGTLLALVLLAAAYLLLWPVPITPVAFALPTAPGYGGVHAANTKLAGLKMIDLHGEIGPEHIVFGPDNKLYTTVASGNILRMAADGSGQEVFANTGGRVLGFDFDAKGNLIAADAIKGLLSIAPDGKTTTVLTDSVNGDPIRYADAVVVAKSGNMYFSDASTLRPQGLVAPLRPACSTSSKVPPPAASSNTTPPPGPPACWPMA
jgi:hypothetical protein